jgi:hypothetical protein
MTPIVPFEPVGVSPTAFVPGSGKISPAGDGGLPGEVPNHTDGILRRGVVARRQDGKRNENRR